MDTTHSIMSHGTRQSPTYEYKLFIKHNNILKFHINLLNSIVNVLCITNLLVYKL